MRQLSRYNIARNLRSPKNGNKKLKKVKTNKKLFSLPRPQNTDAHTHALFSLVKAQYEDDR